MAALGGMYMTQMIYSYDTLHADQARCAKTTTLSRAFVDVIVELGEVNCFTCSQPQTWIATDENSLVISVSPESPLLIDGVTVVEVDGDYLILPDPGAYVLPGTSGRRNIICFDNVGIFYEARLTSPGKLLYLSILWT